MSEGALTIPVAIDDVERLHRVVGDPRNVRGDKPHFMAFYSKTEPARISVDRATYRPAAESLKDENPEARLAALHAGHTRELPVDPRLRVESCPENGNDAHAEIRCCEEHSKNFIKTKVCAMLAEISSMVGPEAAAPAP